MNNSGLSERLPQSVGASKARSIRREPARDIEEPLPSGLIQSSKVDLNTLRKFDTCLNVGKATLFKGFTCQVRAARPSRTARA